MNMDPDPAVPIVQIIDVHKSFGLLEVLRGIDLTVARGEVVCVLGPSGSGKSTLLRCINHLEQVTSGRVFVDGKLVGSIADLVANTGPVFAPLKSALMSQNDLALGAAQKNDISKREVTIMGDKSTPYSVLKKIMLTCSDAEYGKVSFAVVERERAAT